MSTLLTRELCRAIKVIYCTWNKASPFHEVAARKEEGGKGGLGRGAEGGKGGWGQRERRDGGEEGSEGRLRREEGMKDGERRRGKEEGGSLRD